LIVVVDEFKEFFKDYMKLQLTGGMSGTDQPQEDEKKKVVVYRAGNLDVQPTTDSGGGWNVGSIATGERLEWQQVPLQGTTNFSVRVASTNATAKLRFVIDGTAGPTITVPNTGDWQTYQTVSAGDFSFTAGTYHTVRIEFLTGNLNFNYWTTTRS